MKTMAEQMAFYAAYHRNARNRATHFIGVPAIAFAILIPMAWVAVSLGGGQVSLAMAFVFAVLAYYLRLDFLIGITAVIIFVPMLILAEWVAGLTLTTGLITFAVSFVGGWILQLIGHVFERRRPALADNLFQVFVAPLFLIAEVYLALGFKKTLAAEVKIRMPAHLPSNESAGSQSVAAEG
jgi:uncharacterized membrane protein YGL010W